MIKISKVDHQLSQLQGRVIYVWGCGVWGKQVLKVLKKKNIPIAGFCDRNQALWGTELGGVPIYSTEQFQEILKKTPNLLLVIGVGPENLQSVQESLLSFGKVETISGPLLQHVAEMAYMEEFFVAHPEISDFEKQEWLDWPVPTTKRFFRRWISSSENPIFICQPTKTGDYTIMETLEEHDVPYYPMWHKSDLFDKELVDSLGDSTTIKVICAIREPIIRSLSDLYHAITDYDIFPEGLTERVSGVSFFEDGGDVQILFDRFLEAGGGTHSIHGRWKGSREKGTYYEQYFSLFEEYIADVKTAPFDQKKGYSVIKQGNIEVFFYQLEKLNDLVEELGDFVGTPLKQLTNANEAKNKWIAESYEVAKKEITLSPSFFDEVYKDPYIRHCYSEEDIQKFQNKWKSHVK